MVAAESFVPATATTPRWINLSACEPATCGLVSVSPTTGFSLAPPRFLMPPLALIISQASWKPFQLGWPQPELAPCRPHHLGDEVPWVGGSAQDGGKSQYRGARAAELQHRASRT